MFSATVIILAFRHVGIFTGNLSSQSTGSNPYISQMISRVAMDIYQTKPAGLLAIEDGSATLSFSHSGWKYRSINILSMLM